MKSKTTFWGHFGALGTVLASITLPTAILEHNETIKQALAWAATLGLIISAVSKSFGGVAAADAEVVQPEKNDKPEPPTP